MLLSAPDERLDSLYAFSLAPGDGEKHREVFEFKTRFRRPPLSGRKGLLVKLERLGASTRAKE